MIVIASRNEHKFAEISALEAAQGLELHLVTDFPGAPEVEETGVTFEENAAIKAVKYSLWLRRAHDLEPPVLAEDSGLQIEALLGWPGVESARLAPTKEERIRLVLERMAGMEQRQASFAAVTALAVNGHLIATWRGAVQGRITESPRGEGGFGYDPVFEDPKLELTFAELSSVQKNVRSHRGEAWTKALNYVREMQARGMGR